MNNRLQITPCRRSTFLSGVGFRGFYYRRSTQQQAKALGLTGWVRNLADGSVELVATGSPESLKQLESWLWQGPPKASVTAVESRDQALTLFDTFEVVV